MSDRTRDLLLYAACAIGGALLTVLLAQPHQRLLALALYILGGVISALMISASKTSRD